MWFILGLLAAAALALLVRKLRQGAATKRAAHPWQVPPVVDLSGATAVELPYRISDRSLTKAEFAFYSVLKLAVTEQVAICPKVNLGDIFYVPSGPERQTHRNRIDRKHVDFLLCDLVTMRPIAGVELNDSSHQRDDRVERDLLVEDVYRAAGLPLVRFPVRPAYSKEELTRRLAPVFAAARATTVAVTAAATFAPRQSVVSAPSCPKCSVELELKVSKKGAKAGSRFYGCPNYPRCHYIVPID